MRMSLVTALLLGGCSKEVSAEFAVTLENLTAPGAIEASTGDFDVVLAPGVLIVHEPGFTLFEEGASADYEGLEQVAEDGDASALTAALEADGQVFEVVAISTTDETTYAAAPILPGQAATAKVTVSNAQAVSMVLMFGESNDVVLAVLDQALFDGKDPKDTDLSGKLGLYDMGTEVNEEPAVGDNQPMRQSAPNTGPDEDGTVAEIVGEDAKGFSYPPASEIAAFTLKP